MYDLKIKARCVALYNRVANFGYEMAENFMKKYEFASHLMTFIPEMEKRATALAVRMQTNPVPYRRADTFYFYRSTLSLGFKSDFNHLRWLVIERYLLTSGTQSPVKKVISTKGTIFRRICALTFLIRQCY